MGVLNLLSFLVSSGYACKLKTLMLTFFWFHLKGVGTRDYYRRLGYELDGPYMSKSLL